MENRKRESRFAFAVGLWVVFFVALWAGGTFWDDAGEGIRASIITTDLVLGFLAMGVTVGTSCPTDDDGGFQ